MKLLVISAVLPGQAGAQPDGVFHILDLPDGTELVPAGKITLDRDDAAAFQHLLDKHKTTSVTAQPGNPLSKIKEG